DDLVYLETKFNVEKHFPISNLDLKYLISAGLFYGVRPRIGGNEMLYGSDFGPNISGGVRKNRFYSKLEIEKGLLFVKNDEKARFKTSVISLQIGYYFF